MLGSRDRPRFIKPTNEVLYPSRNKDGSLEILINPNSDAALSTDTDSRSNFVYNRYHHLPLETQRQKLPIFQYRNHILYLLERHQTLVLIGETGCGKSTQVPQYLHEIGHKVCVTQPRVTAAVALASRVAEERGQILGEGVGYTAGMLSVRNINTDIVFMTEGVLLREMFASPLLMQYSCIVLDEVHERTQMTDVLMGLLKKIARKRKKLKIIISSATMDAEFLKDFFDLNSDKDKSKGSTSVIMSVQGRTHPVDLYYVQEPVPDYVKATIDTVIKIHENEPFGDILAFLTSQEEIHTALDALNLYSEDCNEKNKLRKHFPSGINACDLSVLPMYGSLPLYRQIKVFQMADSNVRKVILATNIAETSITIKGIGYVIDCGYHKLPYFEPGVNVECLVVTPISKNNATQRAGRAGRHRRGTCYRLYTESEYDKLPTSVPPEMLRSDLSTILLQLKALGINNLLRFTFPTPPPAKSLLAGLETLLALRAIDSRGDLTQEPGLNMAEVPLNPMFALRFTFPTPPPAKSLLAGLETLLALRAIDSRGDLTQEPGLNMAEVPLNPMFALRFTFPTPPPAKSLLAGLETLLALRAIDSRGDLTQEPGLNMAEVPLNPMFALRFTFPTPPPAKSLLAGLETLLALRAIDSRGDLTQEPGLNMAEVPLNPMFALRFTFPTPPPAKSLLAGLETLLALRAIDSRGDLTQEPGLNMAEVPLNPMFALRFTFPTPPPAKSLLAGLETLLALRAIDSRGDLTQEPGLNMAEVPLNPMFALRFTFPTPPPAKSLLAGLETLLALRAIDSRGDLTQEPGLNMAEVPLNPMFALRFTFPTPPPAKSLLAGLETLLALRAIDSRGDLTQEPGLNMAEVPLNPMFALRFTFPTPPPAKSLLAGLETLLALRAIDSRGDLTQEPGLNMAEVPLNPMFALRFTFPTPPPAKSLLAGLETLLALRAIDSRGDLTQEPGLNMAEVPLNPMFALRFTFPTPPPAKSLLAGLETLLALRAIDSRGDLTQEPGLNMAEVPLKPMFAKILCSSGDFGCIEQALSIVCMLQVNGVFVKSSSGKQNIAARISRRNHFEVAEGDVIMYLNIYESYMRVKSSTNERQAQRAAKDWCNKMYINYRVMEKACEIRESLEKLVKNKFKMENKVFEGMDSLGAANTVRIMQCVLSGSFPYSARLHPDGTYRSVSGAELHISPDSCLYNLQQPSWVTFCSVECSHEKTYMRDLMVIDKGWLIELAPHYYRET